MFRGTAPLSMNLQGECFINGDDGLDSIVVDRALFHNCDYLPIGELVEYEAKYDLDRHQIVCSRAEVTSSTSARQVAKHNKIPPRQHAEVEPDAEPEPI
jgi:hypothetical protein